jgi:hypothetical protein
MRCVGSINMMTTGKIIVTEFELGATGAARCQVRTTCINTFNWQGFCSSMFIFRELDACFRSDPCYNPLSVILLLAGRRRAFFFGICMHLLRFLYDALAAQSRITLSVMTSSDPGPSTSWLDSGRRSGLNNPCLLQVVSDGYVSFPRTA